MLVLQIEKKRTLKGGTYIQHFQSLHHYLPSPEQCTLLRLLVPTSFSKTSLPQWSQKLKMNSPLKYGAAKGSKRREADRANNGAPEPGPAAPHKLHVLRPGSHSVSDGRQGALWRQREVSARLLEQRTPPLYPLRSRPSLILSSVYSPGRPPPPSPFRHCSARTFCFPPQPGDELPHGRGLARNNRPQHAQPPPCPGPAPLGNMAPPRPRNHRRRLRS